MMLQFLQNPNLSNEKKTGCLSYIGITSPGMALQVKSTGCFWDLQQKQNFSDLPHVRRVLLICQTQMIRLKAEKQKNDSQQFLTLRIIDSKTFQIVIGQMNLVQTENLKIAVILVGWK